MVSFVLGRRWLTLMGLCCSGGDKRAVSWNRCQHNTASLFVVGSYPTGNIKARPKGAKMAQNVRNYRPLREATSMQPDTFLEPEIVDLNRLPARQPLNPFRSADEARTSVKIPWRRSLDGKWKFKLVDSPKSVPRGWNSPTTSDRSWRSIEVPGCWTRQSTGDKPHYTNIIMPWPG